MTSATVSVTSTLSKPTTEWTRDLVKELDVSFPLRKKDSKRAEQIRKDFAVSRELRIQMRQSIKDIVRRPSQVVSVDDLPIQVQNTEVEKDATGVEESLKAMQDFIKIMQAPQKRGHLMKAARKFTAMSA